MWKRYKPNSLSFGRKSDRIVSRRFSLRPSPENPVEPRFTNFQAVMRNPPSTPPIGGAIKCQLEDWEVSEIDNLGRVAKITHDCNGECTLEIDARVQAFESALGLTSKSCEQELGELIGEASTRELLDFLKRETTSSRVNLGTVSEGRDTARTRGIILNLANKFAREDVVPGKKMAGDRVQISAESNQRLNELKEEGIPHDKIHSLKILNLHGSEDEEIVLGPFIPSRLGVIISALFKAFPRLKPFRSSNNTIIAKRKFRFISDDLPTFRFVLKKTGRELHEVLDDIEKHIGVPKTKIRFAGTKDKGGVTNQFCNVRGVTPEDLLTISKLNINAEIGNIEIQPGESVEIGQLWGNRFKVRLREIDEHITLEAIRERVTLLESNGFANYFGPQRFGDGRTPAIGKSLLKGKYAEALEKFLAVTPFDTGGVKRAKTDFQSFGSPDSAMKKLPFHEKSYRFVFYRLGKMFRGPISKPISDVQAEQIFMGFHELQRSIYKLSYGSLIWNSLLATRLEDSSRVVIEGDFVSNEASGNGLKSGKHGPEIVPIGPIRDIAGLCYNDIILPYPGYEFVDNKAVEAMLMPLLRSDEIELRDFDHPLAMRKLRGGWRRAFTKPGNLEWQLCEGETRDLIMSFDLPKACYATVFLEELSQGLLKKQK